MREVWEGERGWDIWEDNHRLVRGLMTAYMYQTIFLTVNLGFLKHRYILTYIYTNTISMCMYDKLSIILTNHLQTQ